MIFVPKVIVAGFRARTGTVDGQLAYVTYKDEKGVLRKQVSFDGWRNKSIDIKTFDNEPVTGVMINHASKGYKYGWDSRNSFARVYDPRGMEFEINIVNLVYLIKNGGYDPEKGFGELVYAWSNGQLVLLPTTASDYEEIVDRQTIVHEPQKISANDLVVGNTYMRRSGNKSVYLGKFSTWSEVTLYDLECAFFKGEIRNPIEQKYLGKRHVFLNVESVDHSVLSSVNNVFVADLGPTDWAELHNKKHLWKVMPDSLDNALTAWHNTSRASPIYTEKFVRVDLSAEDITNLDRIKCFSKTPPFSYYDSRYMSSWKRNGIWETYNPNKERYYRDRFRVYDQHTDEEFINAFHPFVLEIYLVNGNVYGRVPC